MDPLTEEEVLTSFKGEREDDVPLPDLTNIPWDDLDYLGWVHPSGHLGYVVIVSPDDGGIKGTILRRGRFDGSKPGLEMCSLCHHVHRPNGTAMFTITHKNAERRHSIGNIVCKDLDCSLRIRNLVQPASYLNETLYPEAKIWRMQMALHRWLRTANRL